MLTEQEIQMFLSDAIYSRRILDRRRKDSADLQHIRISVKDLLGCYSSMISVCDVALEVIKERDSGVLCAGCDVSEELDEVTKGLERANKKIVELTKQIRVVQ